VTFLFTDIEGSTGMWQAAPEVMPAALARHDAIVRSAVESNSGYVFSTGGDGFGVAFARAGEAVAAALEAQVGLAAEVWPEGAPIRVRMGLHTGEVSERDGDYFGTPVNQTSRLMALGHGGQVLCSQATASLVGDTVALLDLGDHRLRDLSAARRVFQIGDGRFPALRSVDTVPGNLPTILTELVGRSEDMAGLVALLARERLVTLTGVGGVGKTRLALAVAAASVASFPDGCWFAELAPASTGEEVVRAVAAAMGTAATEVSGLARFLSDRRVLIVLDNCEHVLSDATRLAEAVLGSGPDVVIVATSREPLGVNGEVVRGVRSLTVPDPEVSSAEALVASAVSLFVARATSASERFTLDDSNVDAVVEICAQLDGIPLAIELAAARVRGMAPAEIARRLNERFRLLTANKRSLERHRTLLATVSWSHDLLNDAEKVVFRRLAVFPATFDLVAAEAVVDGAESVDVVDCVLRLVDRSVVVYDPTVDRYRLLETLRQYGAERLAEAGETDATRDRHAEYFVDLAGQSPHPGQEPRLATEERVSAEIDNLRAAGDRITNQGRWDEVLRLCRHLFWLYWSRSPLEGYGLYRSAVERTRGLEGQERVDALGELDVLRMVAGAPPDEQLGGASIALAETAGLVHSPWAWFVRCSFAISSDPSQARFTIETALTVANERDDQLAGLFAQGTLASVLSGAGLLDESAACAAETLRRARSLPHPVALANGVIMAATSYLTSPADPDFEGGLQILEADPFDPESVGPGTGLWLHRMWGLAHLGLGRSGPAVRHLTRSVRLAEQIGWHSIIEIVATDLAVALGEAGQPVLAAQLAGYVDAHRPGHSIRDASYARMQARLAVLRDISGGTTWAADVTAGSRLDRRGFMRILAEAELYAQSIPASQ